MYVYFGQGGDSAGPNFMLDKHIEYVVLGTQGVCPNPLNPNPLLWIHPWFCFNAYKTINLS